MIRNLTVVKNNEGEIMNSNKASLLNVLNAMFLIALVLLFSSCAPDSPSSSTKKDGGDEIVVGVMLPQTGLAAALGAQMKRGIDLAGEDSTSKIKLIFEDDQCDAKAGATAAQKLVSVDNVDAILGPICTVAILSSASLIEESKTPRITTGMVVQKVANAGDYHFSFLPEIKYQMKAIARYAKSKGIKSIAAIALNDDLGRESIQELKSAVSGEDMELVAEEYFEKSETDYKTILSKLTNGNPSGNPIGTPSGSPDAMYMLGYVPNMMSVVKQASELGINKPLLSWNLFQDRQVLGLGRLAEQVTYSFPEDPRNLPGKTSFKQKYKDTYGEDPTLYAANAYDSYRILDSAISECANDRECIKKRLYATKDYDGANGFITVDERGVGQRSEVSIKTVRNGSFVLDS